MFNMNLTCPVCDFTSHYNDWIRESYGFPDNFHVSCSTCSHTLTYKDLCKYNVIGLVEEDS